MSSLHVRYLLVGGGLSSSSAAGAIREVDPEGSILLVGQEVNRPYHRPPLSKAYLRRERRRADLTVVPVGGFAERHIELRTGRRVSFLDTARQAVTLDSGEEVVYDRLLLATGATPTPLAIPGASLPGMFYLRTIEDADRIHHAIEKARAEGRPNARGGRGRVTVIGAGLLGVELAASLTQLGLEALLVAPGDPWDRIAGENTRRFLSAFLAKHGVTLPPPARPDRIEGDGRVQRVALNDGTSLACDFAVAAVGATANKELIRNTPIGAGRAILVDAHCRTNVANVYAAGDCAAVLDPLFGKHRVLDHWDNALLTGRLAGRNMAGVSEAYAGVNRFTTEAFDLTVTVWGEARLVDRRLIRGTPHVDAPAFAEIGVAADGRVAQVIAVGAAPEAESLVELVARRFAVDGHDEALKDPAVPLQAQLD